MNGVIETFNRALFLQERQQYIDAVLCYQEILTEDPHHLASLINISTLFRQINRYEEAVVYFERVLKIKKDYVPIIINYANTLFDLKKYDEAIKIYTSGIFYQSHLVLILNGIATALSKKGEFWHAIAYLKWASTIDAHDSSTQFNLANTYFFMQNYDETISLLEKPTFSDQSSGHAKILILLSEAYQKKGLFQKAINLLKKYQFSSLDSVTKAKIYNLIGKNYGELDDFFHAKEWLEKAVALNSSYVDAHYHLGNVVAESGDFDRANALYRHVLQLNPEAHQAKLNLALNELMQDHWQEGFDLYDARWEVPDYQNQRRYFSCPIWRGDSLQGKKLIVWGEQGIGDEIMFATFFRALSLVGQQVEVVCRLRLVPIFRRSFPLIQFFGNDVKEVDIDQSGAQQIAMGDLPRFLWKESNVNLQMPYLKVDELEKQSLLDRYQKDSKKRVGISWFGGKDKQKTRRSTCLDNWKKIFDSFSDQAIFYSLQYSMSQEDQASFVQMGGIIVPELDPMQNMDSFAAFIAGLDLVISVDNSTVHLAGALGVPCWVLLPKRHEWRWPRRGNTTLWYSSMYLFRNQQDHDWDAVMDAIFEAFKSALTEGFIRQDFQCQ